MLSMEKREARWNMLDNSTIFISICSTGKSGDESAGRERELVRLGVVFNVHVCKKRGTI